MDQAYVRLIVMACLVENIPETIREMKGALSAILTALETTFNIIFLFQNFTAIFQ